MAVEQMTRVASLHPNQRIDVIGFERGDDCVHMIEWLRKGADFRQFVVSDLEAELYAQDADAQLLSVVCNSDLEHETKARRIPGNEVQAVLTAVSITFPLTVRVRAGNGVVWLLDVRHGYQASNMDQKDGFKLRLDFTIVGSRAE